MRRRVRRKRSRAPIPGRAPARAAARAPARARGRATGRRRPAGWRSPGSASSVGEMAGRCAPAPQGALLRQAHGSTMKLQVGSSRFPRAFSRRRPKRLWTLRRRVSCHRPVERCLFFGISWAIFIILPVVYTGAQLVMAVCSFSHA